jgi:hypothetical protein
VRPSSLLEVRRRAETRTDDLACREFQPKGVENARHTRWMPEQRKTVSAWSPRHTGLSATFVPKALTTQTDWWRGC